MLWYSAFSPAFLQRQQKRQQRQRGNLRKLSTDILHAKQQVRDIAFDDDNLGHGSRNAGENAVGNDAPLDIEANSSDEDDVVDTMQAERWPRCCTTRESVTSR